MKRLLFISIVILAMAQPGFADIKTDKDSGVCTYYMLVIGKSKDVAGMALRQADNQARAVQFMETEAADLERMSSRGEWNPTNQKIFLYRGGAACRRIGVRPGDY